MRVLVTGGTGFVGSHIVKALADKGIDVRLLVRSPERVAPALEPLGVKAGDVVIGDATDESAVTSALVGVDSVVHAAAVYSLDVRAAKTIRETNVRATELVLGRALQSGCDPVVYISTAVAFMTNRPQAERINEDSPPGDLAGPYAQSKIASEKVARRLQDHSEALTIIYPGGTQGPHDSHLGDQNGRLAAILRGLLPIQPSGGGYHVTDVRDVAAFAAALFDGRASARRYLVPGNFLSMREMVRALGRATGRSLYTVTMPPNVLLSMMFVLDGINRVVPTHFPASSEGIRVVRSATRVDDSRARGELGISPREYITTARDTVRWLAEAGHISPRAAGSLARAATPD